MQQKIVAFISHYGYAGLFGALVFGIIGLPVPDEVLMTFTGYLISQGRLLYIPAVATAVVGSFIGMSVNFFIGRKLGYPVLVKYGSKIHITKEKLDRTQQWFNRFGKFAVTVGYFIPGVRHLTAYLAGISNWSYRSFFVFALPGATVWAITFITLGTYLGVHWRTVTEAIHRYLLIFVALLLVVGLVIWYVKRKRKVFT